MEKNKTVTIIALILSIVAIIISVYAIYNRNNSKDKKTNKSEKFFQVSIKKEATDEETNDLLEIIKRMDYVIYASIYSKEDSLNKIKDTIGDKASQYTEENNPFSNKISVTAVGTDKEINKLKKLIQKESIVNEIID